MKGCLLLFLCAIPLVVGLRFRSPPALAALGEIYSTVWWQELFNLPQGYVGQNFSVFVPPDYKGCDPIPMPPMTCVWMAQPAPCPNLGVGYHQNWLAKNWQDRGAAALLFTLTGSLADITTSIRFVGRWEATIPVEVFRFLRDWREGDAGTAFNPEVGTYLYLYYPGFRNVTVTFGQPRTGWAYTEDQEAGTVWNAYRWVNFVMSLAVALFCMFKFATFYQHEGKISGSLPQVTLGLATASVTYRHIYLAIGPNTQSTYLPFDVAFALLPYSALLWLAAVFFYSFYLLEVSRLGGKGGNLESRYFIIPSLVCIAATAIITIVCCSLAAALPISINYSQAVQAISGAFLACDGFVFLLLVVVTLVLLRAMMGTNQMNVLIRIIILNVFLLGGITMDLLARVFGLLGGSPNGFYSRLDSYYALYWLTEVSTWLICLTLALAFRISVHKEVELSKSATSSTSSSSLSATSSSSKTSASSSSSHDDPVIEL